MWLLPVDLRETPRAALPPGRYLVPWYYTSEEVVRFAELLRSLLGGIEHQLLLPWDALPVLARGALRSLDKTVLVVRVTDEAIEEESLERAFAEVRCRYALVQLPRPRETGYAWQEQHVKPALASMLEEHLSDPAHPLQALNIGALPVLLAASLTPDALEMIDLLEAAAEHRLGFARYGVSETDYRRSVMLAAGKRLAARLSRLAKEEAPNALEALLAAGLGRKGEQINRGAKALESVGLGRAIGGDLSLGPLGRRIREREVWGGLIDGLPEWAWTPTSRDLLSEITKIALSVVGIPSSDESTGMLSGISPALAEGVLPTEMKDLRFNELLERSGALVDALTKLPWSAESLPPKLQADVVAALRALRVKEEHQPLDRRAPLRAMTALLRMLAARGEHQLEEQERALSEIEALTETSRWPLPHSVLLFAQRGVARSLARRAGDRNALNRASELVAKNLVLAEPRSQEAASAHLAQAEVLRAQGSHAAAHEHVNLALHIFKELEDRSGAARASDSLILSNMSQGALNDALTSAYESLQLWKEAGNSWRESTIHLAMAWLLLRLGKYDKAHEHAEMALTLGEKSENTTAVAGALGVLGELAERRDQLDEASQWYARELKLRERMYEPAALAQMRTKLGELQIKLGAYDEAQAQFEKVLPVAEALENRDLRARLYNDLTTLAELRGASEAAQQWRAKFIETILGDVDSSTPAAKSADRAPQKKRQKSRSARGGKRKRS